MNSNPSREVPNMERPPIVFTARGLPLDTRLNVLGQEFHVHSTILKLKSNFFFKFMDSPDKTVNTGTFKYDWVSSIDDDGTWALVAANANITINSDTSKLKKDQSQQVKCFENLLHAMYGNHYELAGNDHTEVLDQFLVLTESADYYRALPALSNSITPILIQDNFC